MAASLLALLLAADVRAQQAPAPAPAAAWVPAAPQPNSPPVQAIPVSQRQAQAAQPPDRPTVVFPHRPDAILQTGVQLYPRPGEGELGFVVETELPGAQRLFRRESESQVFQRLRTETGGKPGAAKIYFPEEQPITRDKYRPRNFPHTTRLVEPCYVLHRRLLFEQPNFERHGWEVGPFQPALCLAGFYYDVAMLPYHLWTRPLDKTETSAGKCLPGDTVPLCLYPEEFSVTGMLGMAGTYVAGPFIFP